MSDTPTAAAASFPVQFRPDGTIWLTTEDGRLRLRRPKIKELRTLREALEAIFDEHAARAQERRVDQIEWAKRELELLEYVNGDDREDGNALRAANDELVALRSKNREADRALASQAEDDRLRWVGSAFRALAVDGHVPDDADDLDAYMGSEDFCIRLVNHWRSVPLASGG